MSERRPGSLTHLDADGNAHMVGVGHKPPLARRATAEARVRMSALAARLFAGGELPKGDAVAVARIAGIMAAKRTPELIPLCHPLPIDRVAVDVTMDGDVAVVRATVETTARTGVEMEALTAASVAALAVWDMVKGVDPDLAIERVVLVEKVKGEALQGPAAD